VPAVRAVDVSSLRTAASGECVDTSPASAIRCTISVLRKELRRIVLRAHVVNDTEEPVRCAPGAKRDSIAVLQTDLDLICDPHAELGFLFAIPRFGRTRSAFVRVSGTTFACGFEGEIAEEQTRTVALSIGVAAVLIGVLIGVVLYERHRRAPPKRPAAEPPLRAEPVVGEIVEPASLPAVLPEPVRGLQSRGFAAVLDEQRAVMGALECAQRRFASSEFVAKVVNQAAEPLLCSMSGRTRRGTAFVTPSSFWVHPQSAAAVPVEAPLRFPWRLRSLTLQMETSSLRASAQADVPVPPLLRIASIVTALAALSGIGMLAFVITRPTIQAFALPSQVLAGKPATASYALSGLGTGRYNVSFAGKTIASGTVPAGNGSFTFTTSPSPGSYRVTLDLAGPLGRAQESLAVASVSHLAPMTAAVDALEVEPGVAAAGAPVNVRYVAHADAGSVALVDAAQIPLQRVPYRTQGLSVLIAPPVEMPTQYQIVLDVTRGTSSARASVGLLVIPKDLATPGAGIAPSGVLTASELLRVAPAHVLSAHPFVVKLLSHPENLHLTLQDDRGNAVAAQSVAVNAAGAEFRAPYVASDRRFVMVASFTRGTADQVILVPITVYAH
jgi:hypothetical protein